MDSIPTMMFQQPSNEAPSLDDYIQAVAARKWLVVLAAILGLGVAMTYQSSRTSTYEAVARVVIGPSRRLSLDSTRAVAPNLEREREIVLSDSVFEQTALELGTSLEEIHERVKNTDVQFIPASDVLTVSAVDSDPKGATDLVNTISSAYVAQVEAEEVAFFRVRIDDLRQLIESDSTALVALDNELADLNSRRLSAQALPADDISRSTLISSIDADRGVVQTNRQGLIVTTRQSESELRKIEATLSTRPPTASLFSPARIPKSAEGVSASLLYLFGVLFGVSFGIIGAFLLARLDRRARGRDDIELALGQRVLASIPSFGFGFTDKRGEGALVMAYEAKSAATMQASESFRRLRTGVSFLVETGETKAFMLSSAFPGEGKSTVSANLAIALAQAGHQTVIVSADLRRPSLERLFGVELEAGLSEWLGGDEESDLLVDLSQDNLYLVPAGKPAMNSSELLGSIRFGKLVDELKSKFDVVLVDTPPILATADAGAASKHVDGVIIVVDSRKTETDQLLRVRSDLDRAGSNLVGAVLNRERQKRALPWRKRDRYAYN